MQPGALSNIVVVNESRDERVVGDVSIFRSAAEACEYLEHWWVSNGEGFAFTATGDRLQLDVNDKDRVFVSRREPTAEGAALVKDWLEATAAAVFEDRKAKAQQGNAKLGLSEENGRLPTSVQELIEYIELNR